MSASAHAQIGARTAGLEVVGGTEGLVGREYLGNLFLQQSAEGVAVVGNVDDAFLAEAQRGVVVVLGGVLDVEQGGGDGVVALATDDVGIDEGLQVVVGVVVYAGRVEDALTSGSGLFCRLPVL